MNVGRRKPSEYVEDMILCCTKIERYVNGRSQDEFFADTMLQDAILRNIEVLGEAAKQMLDVCPDAKTRFPGIPFDQMYVTRNRLIHGYTSIRPLAIWQYGKRPIAMHRS